MKDLHWGVLVQATSYKANKISAFVYGNVGGCPLMPHQLLQRPHSTHHGVCCHSLGSHQQTLSNSLGKVGRRALKRITQDFIHTTSAFGLVFKLDLQPPGDRHGHDDVQNH